MTGLQRVENEVVGLVAAGIGGKFPGIGGIDGLLNNAADEAVVESCDNNTETASISWPTSCFHFRWLFLVGSTTFPLLLWPDKNPFSPFNVHALHMCAIPSVSTNGNNGVTWRCCAFHEWIRIDLRSKLVRILLFITGEAKKKKKKWRWIEYLCVYNEECLAENVIFHLFYN